MSWATLRKGLTISLLLAAAVAAQMAGPKPAAVSVPVYGYRVVRAYPHDPRAFTEGLFYRDGFLYESTGLNGRSAVRKVQLATGRVLQEAKLPSRYFGEGIVAWKDRLLQLTYTTETGLIYDFGSFARRSEFHYPGQGWSLTHDGHRIIMDDGTPEIRFWDPQTLRETGRMTVTENGQPLNYLNELEWVGGKLYANVWHTDRIAIVDTPSGKVTGWIDLTGLLPKAERLGGAEGEEQVLNGIAYDAAGGRLFVTGKYWPRLFQIEVRTLSQMAARGR